MSSFLSRAGGWLGAAVLLGACTEQQPAQELRSLSGSEDAVFLCRDGSGVGRPYSDCPDRNTDDDDVPARKLSVMALVSQTLTDEVAVVNVSDGHVIDMDPSTPGYGFLRVSGRPVAMATTPGGAASFVATADLGHGALFAIPTSALSVPEGDQTKSDLTTWNACRLDDVPGEIAVVVDASHACGWDEVRPKNAEDDDDDGGAGADVTAERGPIGARKLIVSFPDRGVLRVYDAQGVLNARRGGFEPCHYEKEIVLQADIPAGVTQRLPPDLIPTDSCTDVPAPVAPTPSKSSPRPSGFALSDNRLYVADAAAPVIHVLDVSNACAVSELSPLLPMSLREPERVVTTKRLAVSPVTPRGQQFVYAVDAQDQVASLMVFDVSPGSTDPTPLVRPGSPELAGERPDRLAFASPVRDVSFAYRDIPYVDATTGAAQFGVRCSLDPEVTSGPEALARPNADYTVGARPGLLRGLFGFALLANGSISIIDVDDFDSDCRRPTTANLSSTPDFRGCAGDELAGPYVARNGTPLTTDELSCRVVEPHRPRSARLVLNNSIAGIRAPSLRTLPQFQLPPGQTAVPEERPRLLAVPFTQERDEKNQLKDVAANVFVGSSLFSTDGLTGEPLETNPNSKASDDAALQNSVLLPQLEPRAYRTDETVTVTFEGALTAADGVSGFLDGSGRFEDSAVSFCALGVYDPAEMADYAVKELGVAAGDAEAFGESHGDYVQIRTAFPLADDTFWSRKGEDDDGDGQPDPVLTRNDCVSIFGEADAQTLQPARDLKIVSAFADHLMVKPADPSRELREFRQCFPTAQVYRVRAGNQWVLLHEPGGFRHDVIASGADNRCVRSCNPLYKWQRGRVFEVSSTLSTCRGATPSGTTATPAELLSQRVGCETEIDLACVYAQNDDEYQSLLGSPAERCVFAGLTERFAVYRGRQASARDSFFRWQTTGGFAALEMSLTSLSTVVAPQSIQYLPQSEQLAVVDGASQGLSLFSLDTFGVVKPSPFY